MKANRIRTHVTLLIFAAGFFSCHAISQVPDSVKEADRIVVSGFEPFAERSQNASWVLAQEIGKSLPNVTIRQVPVVWGAPLKVISDITPPPDVWIAFGEGAREFQIEVLAHNERGHSPDNKGNPPGTQDILPNAPATLENAVCADDLAAALSKEGFPTRVSRSAGSYLCEEMLYSLLYTQERNRGATKVVLFVHVPILGSEILTGADHETKPMLKRKVDADFLAMFGKKLFAEMERLKLIKRQHAVAR